jgi:hypothetical protein
VFSLFFGVSHENEHDAGRPQAYWMKKRWYFHINHGYQMRFWNCYRYTYDERRRTKKGRPRGGLMTKKTPCPPCLAEAMRRDSIVEETVLHGLGANTLFIT